jgi:hypothetical protein
MKKKKEESGMRSSKGNSRKKSIKNFKNVVDTKQKGITLIALVITIIVLLILARSKYKYASRR